VRTHPVDKLLEQHCYKFAAGLLQLVRFYVCTHVKISQLVNRMCLHCFFPVFDKSRQNHYHLVSRFKVDEANTLAKSCFDKSDNMTS
jgi:hypothetical protein